MAEKSGKSHPYATEGAALLNARTAQRLTQQGVVQKIGKPKEHIGLYQNWEYGKNRPDPSVWAALTEALKIDIAALYTRADDSQAIPTSLRAQVVKADAVRPLLAQIRRQLDLLDAMVAPAAADERIKAKFGRSGEDKDAKQRQPQKRTATQS